MPIDYRIEVAREPDTWQVVASSVDRQPFAGSATVDPYAFIARLPDDDAQRARDLRAQIEDWQQQVQQLQASLPTAYVGTFSDPGKTYRLYRGDPMAPREEVAPDALQVIGSLGLTSEANESQRRLALARWIVNPQNPLTARVIVNRVWHYHFGSGIVATPSDFGANGVPPSHPELLDWLASAIDRAGLVVEAAAPHDLVVEYLSASERSAPGSTGQGCCQPAVVAFSAAEIGGRNDPRLHAARLGSPPPQRGWTRLQSL